VFAFVLECPDFDAEQSKFIDEVRKDLQAPKVSSLEELTKGVQIGIQNYFIRTSRISETMPLATPPISPVAISELSSIKIPSDPKETFILIKTLLENHKDSVIHQVAADCEAIFGHRPEIMNLVYTAEVNLGMAGGDADKERVLRAFDFWEHLGDGDKQFRASLYYNQGNALGVIGRHRKAIEKYRQALKEMPEHAQGWKNLGNAYLDIGNKSDALQCFEEALRLNPLLFEALYSLATLRRQESDPRGALAYLNRIITSKLTPDQLSWVQGWKAVSYMEQGLFPDGIAKVEEVLAHRPDWEWAWSLAGRLYSLARHEDKTWLGPAEAFWRRFLDKYPQKAEAWAELGFICWFLRKKGNFAGYSLLALRAFTQAISLGFQDDGLVEDRIGHLYQNQGNWLEAEKWYRQAANQNPAAFGYCFGVCLIFLRKYEEALPWVRKAAEKHQPDAKSWFQVALCLGELGRINEAITTYHKAISLDPDYPQAWFNLGGLYWNDGNREQAKITWAEAKARFPGHPLGEQVDKLLD